MSELLTFHSTKFLPPHLTEFVFSLVNLRESFDIKAEKCAVKRTKPKGFTALYKGESALQVLAPVVRRLPKRVKAKQRFFVYDNN